MATVQVNGSLISGGRNITITGNRIFVDGKDVTPDAKDIRIEVQGNVESLSVDACNSVTVNGDIGKVRTASGDVRCGNVGGSVNTMSGDVICGDVSGDIETMSGDISRRR